MRGSEGPSAEDVSAMSAFCLQQVSHSSRNTGKMPRESRCQGKHGEFENFA